jgi:hypothetical protein
MKHCTICKGKFKPRELTKHKGQIKCRECMCADTEGYLEAAVNRALHGASDFAGIQCKDNQYPWSLRAFNKQLRESMERQGIPVGDDRYRRYDVSQ